MISVKRRRMQHWKNQEMIHGSPDLHVFKNPSSSRALASDYFIEIMMGRRKSWEREREVWSNLTLSLFSFCLCVHQPFISLFTCIHPLPTHFSTWLSYYDDDHHLHHHLQSVHHSDSVQLFLDRQFKSSFSILHRKQLNKTNKKEKKSLNEEWEERKTTI